MHIIITGATGTIGMAILDVLLNDPQVTKLSILTRSPVNQAWGHDKADVIHVKDFGTWTPELLNRLSDAQGCIWALGDTRRDGVDTADLQRINVEYPNIAAKALTKGKSQFNFVFLSVYGVGVTEFEDVVDKGKAEAELLPFSKEEPAFKLFSIRLCAMDSRGHAAIHKYVKYPRPWYKVVAAWLIPIIKYWYPTHNCDSPDFGFLLTELAKSDGSPIDHPNTFEDGRVLDAPGFNDMVKRFREKKSLDNSSMSKKDKVGS